MPTNYIVEGAESVYKCTYVSIHIFSFGKVRFYVVFVCLAIISSSKSWGDCINFKKEKVLFVHCTTFRYVTFVIPTLPHKRTSFYLQNPLRKYPGKQRFIRKLAHRRYYYKLKPMLDNSFFQLLHIVKYSVNNFVTPKSHYVLLKHYYSVDFQWWFDRKLVSLVSSAKLGNCKKKSCQMAEIQNCTLLFDRKTVSVEFCQLAVLDWDFISIWKPNPCMDPLEKKILLYQFLF